MKLRKRWTVVVALMAICAFVCVATAQNQNDSATAQQMHETPPYWAYAVDPPAAASNAPANPVDNTRRHVPGSTAGFTLAQIGDLFTPPDWHPAGHPAMPDIVAH